MPLFCLFRITNQNRIMNKIEHRVPVDENARRILNSRHDVDYNHPNFNDALRICEVLSGSGLLRKGIPTDEAIRLIINILGDREVVVTEIREDKERLALDKEKLNLERSKIAARNAERIHWKEQRKLKQAQIEASKEWPRIFVTVAKQTLDVMDFMAVRDMTDEIHSRQNVKCPPTGVTEKEVEP